MRGTGFCTGRCYGQQQREDAESAAMERHDVAEAESRGMECKAPHPTIASFYCTFPLGHVADHSFQPPNDKRVFWRNPSSERNNLCLSPADCSYASRGWCPRCEPIIAPDPEE